MREHIVEMLNGPGTTRFIVQPALALLVGALHGLRDVRKSHPAVMTRITRAHGHRLGSFVKELRLIVIPLTIAVGASLIFQYIIRSRVRIGYAFLYALLFVVVPYFLARDLVARSRFDARRGLRSI